MTTTEDLMLAFNAAAQTDNTPRVKDQWGRVHRIEPFESKTRCGLKKEANWVTSPSDGLPCKDGCE